MSTTDTAFTGSIPAEYERHMVPLFFAPYADDLAARLSGLALERLLETACGTGAVTRAIVRRLAPSVEITATDLNQGMLDFASRLTSAQNVSWRQCDAQALPFGDAEFDAVVCQFGVMFMPDKAQAFREALRVLRPGGRFLFNVWGPLEANEVSKIVSDAVADLFPDDPPRFFARTPFGYGDPDLIRSQLREAGFEEVEIAPVEKTNEAASAWEPATGLCRGTPLRGEIETRDASRLDEAIATAARALQERLGEGTITNRMLAYVATAARP